MLAPLGCSSCGRPVAVADGDTVRCSFCDAAVEVPEAYAQLRIAACRDDVARAQAEAIAVELARPASTFVRFWIAAANVAIALASLLVIGWLLVSLVLCIAVFVDAGIFGAAIMLLVGLVLGVPLLWDEALHGLSGPLQADLADVLSAAGAHGLLGLSIFVGCVLPLVLGAYAQAFESVRIALRTALAAAPAATPTGAVSCRSCGAPLHVALHETQARCMYCRADNLVLLPDAALGSFEDAMKTTCADLEAALQEERAVARTGKRLAALRITRWAAIVPGCILLGRCVASINEDDATFWERAVPGAPMIPNVSDNPVLERGQPTLFDVHETFDGCSETECWVYYFVALQPGESAWISAEGGDLRLETTAERHVGPWYDPTYEWRVPEAFTGAPHAGWYRVTLVAPKRRGPQPVVTWGVSR